MCVLAVRDRGTAADPCLSCSVQDGLCPRVCTGTGQSTCCSVTQVCGAPLTIGQMALCVCMSSVQSMPVLLFHSLLLHCKMVLLQSCLTSPPHLSPLTPPPPPLPPSDPWYGPQCCGSADGGQCSSGWGVPGHHQHPADPLHRQCGLRCCGLHHHWRYVGVSLFMHVCIHVLFECVHVW